MSERFIDKYEVVATVGRGSMGVVYKAQDPEIGRLVAIKTLKSVFMGDDPAGDEALQRFRQESRSAGKLHHPNIVTIFEAGKTDNGSPYIVMEYIEGTSLEGMVAEGGRLDPLAIIHYLGQIGSAIDYAHSQNVIHRDIKPSNIIVDAGQKPYLVDFGVAKLSDTSLTPAGTVVGTPSYMSPEQIRGATLDGRTDLFSLGVVAFELFTGVRPFPGNDFTTVVSNIMHKPPRSFDELGVDLPVELEQLLAQALHKEREQRFQSALLFADSLAKLYGVVVDGSGLAGGYEPGKQLARPVTGSGASSSTVEGGAANQRLGAGASSEVSAMGGPMYAGGKGAANGFARQDDDFETMQNSVSELTATPSLQGQSIEQSAKRNGGWAVAAGSALVVLLMAAMGYGYWFLYSEPSSVEADSQDKVRIVQLPLKQLPEVSGKQNQASAAVDTPAAAELDDAKDRENTSASEASLPEEPEKGFSAAQVGKFSDAQLQNALTKAELSSRSLAVVIAEAGRRSPEDFVRPLLEAAEHPDFLVRAAVLKVFHEQAYRAKDEVLQSILKRLSDKEFVVRGFAARALEGVQKPEVREALQARLDVEQKKVVRSLITKALESGSS